MGKHEVPDNIAAQSIGPFLKLDYEIVLVVFGDPVYLRIPIISGHEGVGHRESSMMNRRYWSFYTEKSGGKTKVNVRNVPGDGPWGPHFDNPAWQQNYFHVNTWGYQHYKHTAETHPECSCQMAAVMD